MYFVLLVSQESHGIRHSQISEEYDGTEKVVLWTSMVIKPIAVVLKLS